MPTTVSPTRTWGPRIPIAHPDHLTAAAMHLLGITSPTWKLKRSEVVDKTGGRHLGFIVVGSETRLLTRGPRKGAPTWIGDEDRVVVSHQDLADQYTRFEKTTGLCSACYGIGKRNVGAGPRGTLYQNCDPCGTTGKAQGLR